MTPQTALKPYGYDELCRKLLVILDDGAPQLRAGIHSVIEGLYRTTTATRTEGEPGAGRRPRVGAATAGQGRNAMPGP